MHHVAVDQWSRGTSALHALDPRAKLLALLFFLIALATTPPARTIPLLLIQMSCFGVLLLLGSAMAGFRAGALEKRALVVVPLAATFALITWFAGEPQRAVQLLGKSYLSALAALLVVATTPIPALLAGLAALGAPRAFVLVVQFLYRYLFVISEQGQQMRRAAACRQAAHRARARDRFRGAAGAVAVLFAKSYARAEGIHRAMISRGFTGRFAVKATLRIRSADIVFLSGWAATLLVLRFAISRQ